MAKAHAEQQAKTPQAPFPHELELRRGELVAASMSVEDPVEWPEGEKILTAHAPAALGQILVKQFHVGIRRRTIAYLWRENMGDGTRVTLGKASKASATIQFLSKHDFLIFFNHAAWKMLSFEQRVALVDHELQHLDVDSETGHTVLVPHDVEEFGVIVHRYGLWKPDLKSFGDRVKEAMQPDLWDQPAPPPPATAVTSLRVMADEPEK